jgi:tRNA threonylcarbamoyladenosine biosynthesis protein TsaE
LPLAIAGFLDPSGSIKEAARGRQAGLEAGTASPQHSAMQRAAAESDTIELRDEAATLALGRRLARVLKPGDVLALRGPLGAGKTTLARGLIRAWTGEPDIDVPSPTFTLAQIYESAAGALWHMDLYRLKAPEEALEIGLEEALATALCVVEWPERLLDLLPASRVDLVLQVGEGGRRARISWHGDAAARRKEFSFA